MTKIAAIAFTLVAMALLPAAPAAAETIAVKLPELTPEAQAGAQTFIKNCSQCHGMIGGGTDKGPPLIHRIYEPNHHGDFAFFRAVQQGTPAHHWPYGDMAPLPNVSEAEVTAIVKFIREVQRANGIE
ncbi:MAG: cytochrome c [Alphaproteobacteria bacterium]|jgi:mono/diheme cytochrome c family protein|nr:cytochrome c [Alphaproteobacteria bacterium]MDP6818096.1 cytochrome c [Alphaproteobacteria bacterium]|tara:strand:+ start:94 stop:477 length:384 start_codon:yes stop_codon:yes gene_type:complete